MIKGVVNQYENSYARFGIRPEDIKMCPQVKEAKIRKEL
jgi:hypothetical protein